jgi:DNA-3-methyladenine glycosylase
MRKGIKVLPKGFYQRDPALVAKELLGKLLIRKLGRKELIGRVVETEAYYGKDDPASRASSGRPKFCVELLYDLAGKTLIYMVHGHWLFNVIAHQPGKVGGVLIRALQPLKEIDEMIRNRGTKELHELTRGPGKLTRALKITKELNGVFIASRKSEILIADDGFSGFKLATSKRVGVTKDLPTNLRFYIKGSLFVSKG